MFVSQYHIVVVTLHTKPNGWFIWAAWRLYHVTARVLDVCKCYLGSNLINYSAVLYQIYSILVYTVAFRLLDINCKKWIYIVRFLHNAENIYFTYTISLHTIKWYIFLALVDTPHMLGSRYYAVAWDNLCAFGQMIPTFSIRTSFSRCTASDKMCIGHAFFTIKICARLF